MAEMEKVYEPKLHEARIYKMWEDSGAFAPSDDPQAEPYTVLMPPPNANDNLHLGHTLTSTLQDIMIRHARMNGKAALFIPGADHAGFETQVVFERKLNQKGQSRFDFDHPTLYQMIWDYVQENKTNMEDQQRRIGASVDWNRNTFTLDPHVVKTAHATFKKMWEDDLLYRGERIVNYCTFHGTSFSDLEVEHKEVEGHLWTLDYLVVGSDESIQIATTRPETLFGDTAVAVHPEDERYSHLIGKMLHLPLTDREIPVIADDAVERDFGTGAVKITPAHDPNDFDMGERHNLPAIEVIGKDGLMTAEAPRPYQGLTALDARAKTIEALTAEGFHVKTTPYTHSVGHCYKCGNVIQPLILKQWLIKVKPLAKQAILALERGDIAFAPASKKAVLTAWYENLHDWNISRQIVWGIQIPAFIAEDGDIIVDIDETSEHIIRDGKRYQRDPDTFDTWFSSAQWPVVTLGYPDSPDITRFYPTAVMETGADILFWWVSRMIMMGLYLTGEVPFKTVYLHGMVTDEHGKKMSKSKGNVLAPMPLLDAYGADALRLGLIAARSAGQNQGFSEKRVEGYRNFNNKLWNVSRFILGQLDESITPDASKARTVADHWILERFSRENAAISDAICKYRFSEAGERLYSLLWNDLADWYVEASKVEATPEVLAYCLDTILRLAHPFVPFITETIWQNLPWQKGNLITSQWPKIAGYAPEEASRFDNTRKLIVDMRAMVAELQLQDAQIITTEKELVALTGYTEKLARTTISWAEEGSGLALVGQEWPLWVTLSDQQLQNYTDKIRDKLVAAERIVANSKQRLSNERYVQQAPAELVAETREQLREGEDAIKQLRHELDSITS